MRFGIIGPGAIAEKVMRDFHLVEGAEMRAVASRDIGRARAFAQRWGIPVAYGFYEEVCRDPEVEVVYIATPNPLHIDHALMAMRHGKHVVVEKPVTLNAAEFQRLVDCARERGVFLMDGMWTRFFPVNENARQLLRGGAIGALRAVQVNFVARRDPEEMPRLFLPELGGGALLDLGCYALYYALDMFGEAPLRVRGDIRRADTGVDSLCSIVLEFREGLATLLVGFDAHSEPGATLMGTRGSIFVPYFSHPRLLHLRKDGEEEQVMAHPYEEYGFAYQMRHVVECVRAGKQQSEKMPWEGSLMGLRVMDALRADWGIRYPQEEASTGTVEPDLV